MTLRSISENNSLIQIKHIFLIILTSAFMESKLFGKNNFFLVSFNANNEFDKNSLVLADTYSDELTTQNPRPLIIVNRESSSFSEFHPDNQLEKKDILALRTEHATTINSTITLKCYGRNTTECENLSWAVAALFILFRKHMRTTFNLVHMSMPSIGPVVAREPGSKLGLFYCDIRFDTTSPFYYTTFPTDPTMIKDFPVTIKVFWDPDNSQPVLLE
jgi:hypothetical protein